MRDYRFRPGSSAHLTLRFIAAHPDSTRREIEKGTPNVAQRFNDNTQWHALQYMEKRGVLATEVRRNPKTKRVAKFYSIAPHYLNRLW